MAERKQWTKFGQEKGKPAGPQTDTVSVAENILFRPVAAWKASNEDKGDEAKKKAELKNAKIKCRICQGDHFTTKCPFKDTMAPEGDVAPADMPDDAPGGASGGLGSGQGGYVPPHLRGRAGAGEKMGGKFDRDDSATLRVTNVSEFAEEQDLRDMFSRYGHVTRVFLAKDRETGRAKGFAFVSYADRSDAAKACEKMDGCKSSQCLQCCEAPYMTLRQPANSCSQSVSAISSCVSSLPKRPKDKAQRRPDGRKAGGHAHWRSHKALDGLRLCFLRKLYNENLLVLARVQLYPMHFDTEAGQHHHSANKHHSSHGYQEFSQSPQSSLPSLHTTLPPAGPRLAACPTGTGCGCLMTSLVVR